MTGERETSGRVEVTVRDLYRKNHRLYLRYAVVNHTGAGYLPSRPAAWFLEGVRAQQSLIPAGERQLGEKLARTRQSPMPQTTVGVVDADQTATGRLRVVRAGAGLCWKKPDPASPDTVAVLRLQFAADAKGEVDARPGSPARRRAGGGPCPARRRMSRECSSVKEVHAEFEKLLRDRHHMGLRNLMGDTFLEPAKSLPKETAEAQAVGGRGVWTLRCSDF